MWSSVNEVGGGGGGEVRETHTPSTEQRWLIRPAVACRLRTQNIDTVRVELRGLSNLPSTVELLKVYCISCLTE